MCDNCQLHSTHQRKPHTMFQTRQRSQTGGPPFPLSFSNVCYVLSVPLMQAELQKSIKGIKLGNQGCSFTHLFLLMIPCFSSKMIKTPVVTLKESLIGTVISLDNALTIINLIYIALQTCLRRNKCPCLKTSKSCPDSK